MACVGQPTDQEWENKDDLCREEFQGKKKICQKTEEKERRSAFNEIEAFVLSGFRRKKIRIFIYFFKIMLMWKTVGASEASIFYNNQSLTRAMHGNANNFFN